VLWQNGMNERDAERAIRSGSRGYHSASADQAGRAIWEHEMWPPEHSATVPDCGWVEPNAPTDVHGRQNSIGDYAAFGPRGENEIQEEAGQKETGERPLRRRGALNGSTGVNLLLSEGNPSLASADAGGSAPGPPPSGGMDECRGSVQGRRGGEGEGLRRRNGCRVRPRRLES
jgi:hypothetical protein